MRYLTIQSTGTHKRGQSGCINGYMRGLRGVTQLAYEQVRGRAHEQGVSEASRHDAMQPVDNSVYFFFTKKNYRVMCKGSLIQ
jgi:hypothetical protein